MSSIRRCSGVLLALALMLAPMALTQPTIAWAATDLVPVVSRDAQTDDEQVYIWSIKTEISYKLFSITGDDLMNFASAPKGTTIQFPAELNRGTVSLTYQGDGKFTGKFQEITFAFVRGETAGVVEGDWNCWALAEARAKELKASGRTIELSIAEAIQKVLGPLHHQLALAAEKELTTTVVAKVSENKDTGGQDIWVWLPKTKVGYKLISLAKDDLMNFASAPVGATIQFPSEGNRGTITLTYNGSGKFTGTYLGTTFSFTQSGAASVLKGDLGCLALAKARVPALKTLGRTEEWNVAKAILAVLSP